MKKYKSWLDKKKDEGITDSLSLASEIGANIYDARIGRGFTQEKLAKKMKTLQPSIARVEAGSHLPSFDFLLRVAKALDASLIPPRFKGKELKK